MDNPWTIAGAVVGPLAAVVGVFFLLRRAAREDMKDAHGVEIAAKDATIQQKDAVIERLKLDGSAEFSDGLQLRIRALEAEKESLKGQQAEEGEELRAEIDEKTNQIQTLLSLYGTDRDGSGLGAATPLHMAAREGHADIAKMLLDDMGAHVNAQDNDGCTPLHRASANDKREVAALLLEREADVNAPDSRGETSLHWAASFGHREMAELLLERGAQVDAKTSTGMTPLHEAASCGYREVVALLLERGAHINATDSGGVTPLHWASREEHRKVAELLLQHGAELDAQANSGLTPLHLAAREGHGEVVELLREWGTEE